MKPLKTVLDWADDRTQVILAMVILFIVAMLTDITEPREKIAIAIISGLFGLVTGYSVGKMNGTGKPDDQIDRRDSIEKPTE